MDRYGMRAAGDAPRAWRRASLRSGSLRSGPGDRRGERSDVSDPLGILGTVKRFLPLDLETVPDESLVGAVDGEPSRPYPEQVKRLLAERRERSGGRSDFLPLPYHRPVAACTLEAVEEAGALSVVDVSSWTNARGDDGSDAREAAFLARLWE